MTIDVINVAITTNTSKFLAGIAGAKGALGGFIAMMGPLALKLAGITALIGSFVIPIGFMIKKTRDLALEYEQATNIIMLGTGASGEALDELKQNFRNVFAQLPESSEIVADALQAVNTRLQLTGTELENMTIKMLQFARINKVDVGEGIRTSTRLINALGLTGEEASSMLDKLTLAGQNSGISVTNLADLIIDAGSSFENLFGSVDRQIALFAEFERIGARPEEVINSLVKAQNVMVEKGLEPSTEAFQALIDEIRYATTESEALLLANDLFGQRVGGKIKDDIRAGRFEIGELAESYENASDIVKEMAMSTMTLSERKTQLGNAISAKLMPGAESLNDIFEKIVAIAHRFIQSFIEGIDMDKISKSWGKLTDALTELGKTLGIVGREGAMAEEIGVQMGQRFTDAIVWIIDKITKLVGWLEENQEVIKGNIKAARDFAHDAGEKIITIIDKVVRLYNAFVRAKDAVSPITDAIKAMLTPMQTAIDAANRLKDAMSGASNVGLVGSIVSIAGARAMGGPVISGSTYLVGEQGPELFTPSSSGQIIPNHDLGKSGNSSKEIVMNNTFNNIEMDPRAFVARMNYLISIA